MVDMPAIDDIKNCNTASVYLKNAEQKPVKIIVQGNFQQVSDNGDIIVLKTDSEYAIFKTHEVVALHFCYIQNPTN